MRKKHMITAWLAEAAITRRKLVFWCSVCY